MSQTHGSGRRRPLAVWLGLGGMLLVVALTAGCASDGGDGGPDSEAGGIPGEDSAPAELHQPIANVTGVNLSIWNNVSSQYLVSNVPLTQQPDLMWQGLFTGLPRHASLTYEAEGLIGAVVDFTGQTTAAISTATGTVQVVLRPFTGNTFTMAKVTAITNPSPIQRGATANYVFFLNGEPNETLTWNIVREGAASTGTFATPTTGTVTLDAAGSGSHTHAYTAPTTGGPNAIHNHTHYFEITDAEGVTFRAYFPSTSCDLDGGVIC